MRLPFSSFLKSSIASLIKTYSDLFWIYVLQIVVQSATCRNVAVPRVNKFYEKNRSKKLLLSEKPCYEVKAFLAQDVLKIKWLTNVQSCICDNS